MAAVTRNFIFTSSFECANVALNSFRAERKEKNRKHVGFFFFDLGNCFTSFSSESETEIIYKPRVVLRVKLRTNLRDNFHTGAYWGLLGQD